MQHQCEDRAVSQMIADCLKELFDIFLMDIPGEAVTLIDVMSVRDDWIGDFIFADIRQVVKEHPQSNQSSSNRGRRPSQPLLPLDECINIMDQR